MASSVAFQMKGKRAWRNNECFPSSIRKKIVGASKPHTLKFTQEETSVFRNSLPCDNINITMNDYVYVLFLVEQKDKIFILDNAPIKTWYLSYIFILKSQPFPHQEGTWKKKSFKKFLSHHYKPLIPTLGSLK